MPTLYVVEPGARIEKEYHRLLVTKQDEVLLRVPLVHVTQVVLVGNVGVTTPALHALLQANIPLLLVRRTGSLVGRLLPPTLKNLPLRQAQFRRNDEAAFALSLARAIVQGKLRNQRVLALRVLRRRPEADRSALEALYSAESRAPNAPDLQTLLGIEGAGAKAYFELYRQAFAPEWGFQKRTRRPPKDPVNALLSLGYTLLGNVVMTALEAVGLDPYLGFFHAEKYGRPALALDLVEEFRAPLVDSLVMRLINWRMLSPQHFEQGPTEGEDDEGPSAGRTMPGVVLNDRGSRIFFREFGDRLESEVLVEPGGRALSYRKHVEIQARKLAHVINGDEAQYVAFTAR
ncbi:MAG: CRISPR-associated endonuclease Cas1 [Anaerolineae bacterium]|nr:CRISPR-associated endonuclease Cas1 [Anaerolineae bacterium]